jgi:transposase
MAKTIYASENDIYIHKNLTEILQLQDLVVVGQEFHENSQTLILNCVPRWSAAICPDCRQLCGDIHDYLRQRTIYDTPIRGNQTLLRFDVHRFWCKGCQNAFIQPIGDVVPECTYTYRLMAEIADPKRKQAVATLAQIYHLGYKLVESIILKAGQSKVAARTQAPLKVEMLGVDELAHHKGHGSYVLVITDLKRRIIVDILPDRQKQTLMNWLTNPPKGVDLSALTTVATDLWGHYREAVKIVYPHVSVVADRFHVVQNLQQVIHTCRREAQAHATSQEEKKQLKGLRYLLLKDESKLTYSEEVRLKALVHSHPQLFQLVQLRQELHEWYETKTTPALAQVTLTAWITQAKALGLTALNQFTETLTHWQTEIVNFFAHRVTSGFVEGMNCKIRLLHRLAFGLPNFQHFRSRLLWACG